MAHQSDSNEMQREVDASMRMFEKSHVGDAPAITPIKPSRVLVVLDGSPQDDTSVEAAKHLRQIHNVESVVLDARQQVAAPDGGNPESTDLAPRRAEEISGARPLIRLGDQSYDAILNAIDQHDVDLVILPCPFGRSFEQVGTDSAGTTIDVMLSRCPKPMLVVRRCDQQLAACSGAIRFIVGSESDVEQRAAAWAFGLAGDKAAVTLNLVVENEQFENIRSILEAIHPGETVDRDAYREALTKTHHCLHESMAKTASALGMRYHLQPQAGEVAPPNPLNESTMQMLVIPLEVDDRFGQGFAQDRIRRSPHPVLVVPGHVRKND